MPRLQILHISRIGRPLKIIEDFAFDSISLQILRMEQTNFHFDKERYNPETEFAYCPNLTDLSLSHSICLMKIISWKKCSHHFQNCNTWTCPQRIL